MAFDAVYQERRKGLVGAGDVALRAVIRNTAGAALRYKAARADLDERIADLVSLRAEDPRPLDIPDFKRAGAEDNVHPGVIHALANIEGGLEGFYTARIRAIEGEPIEDPGKLVPLVEPHLFSALTLHAWDTVRADVSYPTWTKYVKGTPPPGRFSRHPYSLSYDERWGLFVQMAELDCDAAIGSVSLGRFQQVVGSPRPTMGWKLLRFSSAEALFRELAKSEFHQLEIMRLFFKANGGMSALRNASKQPVGNPNWRTLARIYNGEGQVDKYSKLFEAEFIRIARYYG